MSPWMLAVQQEGHHWWDDGGEQASTGAPWEAARPRAHIKQTHTIPGCPTPVNAHALTLEKKTGLQQCQNYNMPTEQILQPWAGFSGWSRRAGGCIAPSRLLQSGCEEEAPFSLQDHPCPHQKLVEDHLWKGEFKKTPEKSSSVRPSSCKQLNACCKSATNLQRDSRKAIITDHSGNSLCVVLV